MKYLKLYEDFQYDEEIVEMETEETEETLLPQKSKDVYQDSRGVYHIKSCEVY
jgi:hypothetical protein